MEYCGYVTKIENLRKHPNADRLQLGECFNNTVCVSMNYYNDQIGVYFPADLQLSEEFCEQNNLVQKLDENGKNVGGYLSPIKRRVTAIRLRGEKSDGLFLPLSALDYCFEGAANTLNIGDHVSDVNGHHICNRYYIAKPASAPVNSSKGRKRKIVDINYAPLFQEHIDTEQLAYNLDAFHAGDEIEISIKMHGTSFRTANLPVLISHNRSLLDRIFRREGKPVYTYDSVTGTRRTIIQCAENAFYGNHDIYAAWGDNLKDKLYKGETVYGEIVGWVNETTPIMPSADNKKLNDKEFVKQYGDTTDFTYGCARGTNDLYVYRMTLTNEEGYVVEYSPDLIRYRCKQMGMKTVNSVFHGFIPSDCENPGEWVLNKAEEFYDGPDPVGGHIREGVVVRIVNRPTFKAYKHKNFAFKVLSGIAVDNVKNTENISEDILNEY